MTPRDASSGRPPRLGGLPLLQLSAADLGELARAVRTIYAGGLADGRALAGRDGVYTVRANPPLMVTDEGLTIDLHDPRWSDMLRLQCSDAEPSAVDRAEAGHPGELALPARGDHRHAHADLPAVAELPDSRDLTFTGDVLWDPQTATLTLQRADATYRHDAAGHGAFEPDDVPAADLAVVLTGLVGRVGDGVTEVAPCHGVAFCGGEGVDVAAASDGSGGATVTLSCTLRGLPAGTQHGQLLYWDHAAGQWRRLDGPGGAYRVLQGSDAGEPAWDWVRAH